MTDVKQKGPPKTCKHLSRVQSGQDAAGWVYWCPTCGAIERSKGSTWGGGTRYWTLPAVSR